MFRARHTATVALCLGLLVSPALAGDSGYVPSAELSSSAPPRQARVSGSHHGKGISARVISTRGRFRRGWTAQVSAGGGYQVRELEAGGSGQGAVATPSVGAGIFLQDWVALLLRCVTTLTLPNDSSEGSVITSGFVGLSAQLWPFEWLVLEVGAGFGYHLDRADPANDGDLGVGLLGGLHVPVFQRQSASIQLGVTYTPLFLERSRVHAVTLEITLQYL